KQSSGPNRTVDYNHFELPLRIRSAVSDVSFKYDAMHRRVEKRKSPFEATTYIGDAYERRITSTGTEHRFKLPGGIGELSMQESSLSTSAPAVVFFHRDSLGTPETISSPQGAVVEKLKYEPFGQRRYASALTLPASLPSSHSDAFTGHEADDEFGLINMRGRMYDSATGRFLTADPFVQAPLFSQSFNRYSYTFNNPINFVDPSGFEVGIGGVGPSGTGASGYPGSGGGGNPGGGGPIMQPGTTDPFVAATLWLNSLFHSSPPIGGAGSQPSRPQV